MPAPTVAEDNVDEDAADDAEPVDDAETDDSRPETGISEDTEQDVDQDLAEIPADGSSAPDPSEVSESDDPADAETETADPFEDDDDIEVDLADTTVGDESTSDDSDAPFSGDDEVETPTSGEGQESSEMSASDIQQGMDALGEEDHLDEAINEGFARLAVVGLDDGQQKDSLEMEFCEVFEMFRLGHFGSQAVSEYILTDPDEEVDPLWAFAVSLTLSTALVVYMRPDRDEIVASARDSVTRFTDGAMGVL
jgi:hypothetical protein